MLSLTRFLKYTIGALKKKGDVDIKSLRVLVLT